MEKVKKCNKRRNTSMKYFLVSIVEEDDGIYGPFNTIKDAKEWLRGISLSACVLIRGTIIEKIYK